MTSTASDLPPDFLWGITSAATAIEGRPTSIGGQSIWHAFAAAEGRIADGTLPNHGPRHHEHWRSDVKLLAELGVNAYRLSLPWSVLHGDEFDSEIAFYDELVDALLTAGIRPVVTATHYDMPLTVMMDGGWLVRESAEIFADYAGSAAGVLADRVHDWVTINSPLVHTAYGYGAGIEAPGLTLLGGALQAGAHQLIAHGLATQSLRAAGARRVGIANNHTLVRPAGDSEADVDAARIYDALHNRAFTDPLLLGTVPTELAGIPGAESIEFSDADLAAIRTPMDFYGVNYFHPVRVAAAPENRSVPFTLTTPDGPLSEAGWPVEADALTTTLLQLTERYPGLPPVILTETGIAGGSGGEDPDRETFLTDHVAAALAARRAGVDLRGFFFWTLLDGWEFGEGLTRSYGLVATDPHSGVRTPRSSFHRYRRLIRELSHRSP